MKMDEFIVIKVMNESMLRLKRDKNMDYTINEKIKEEVYKKLTNKNMYDKLVREGKINTTDKLTIKYD